MRLDELLYSQLAYFFELEAEARFISPKRFHLFLAAAKAEKLYRDAEQELKKRSDKYSRLEEQAHEKGYKFNPSSDLLTTKLVY